MSELYRALTYLLVVSLAAIWFASKAFAPAGLAAGKGPSLAGKGLPPASLAVVWATVTVCAFVSPYVGVFLLVAAVALQRFVQRESVPAALYLAAILMMPGPSYDLPTFGLVGNLLVIDWYMVCGLVVLGAAMRRVPAKSIAAIASRSWLIAYLCWVALLDGTGITVTAFLRFVIQIATTYWLPFEGIRRGFRDWGGARRILVLYTVTACAVAAVSTFEHFRRWLLYTGMWAHWGTMNHYLLRNGELRAEASIGQAIALCLVLAVAIPFASCRMLYPGRPAWRKWVLLVLIAGMYGSASRGPWVAALVGAVIQAVLSEGGGVKRASKILAGVVLALGLCAVLPGGQKILDLLPFVSTKISASEEYRADLFRTVFPLLLQHPIQGIPDFNNQPEMQHLRQGEGIIDLVNAYIGVGVSSGLVGLFLFAMVHLNALWRLYARLRESSGEKRELLVAVFAAYCTALFALTAVSSILAIGPVTWALAGLSSTLVTLPLTAAQEQEQAPTPSRAAVLAGRRARVRRFSLSQPGLDV